MKTSNKLLIAAITLLLLSTALYDFQLKAQYKKGDFRNRFGDFINLNLSGFKIINLKSSTAINIMLAKGPFKVLADPDAMEFARVEKHGDTLMVEASFRSNFHNARTPYVLYVSCPEISEVIADAHYIAYENHITDTLAAADFSWRPTVITGFTLNSLKLSLNHASNITLENDSIATLNAVTGIENGSASNLILGINNHIGNARLDIRNKSRLWIKEAVNTRLNYQIADSAKLIVNGASQNILKFKQP
ncbi:hypothetical protein ACFFGT_11965 [Mucilaginibacter angelicae]|uniref:Auto-transporter adhesin head GIN domain-containing protein n=1 Tax=Mucilaginibacter angelicae TaxID=869718 RepID=A0ABV6L615_9SPHI